MPDRVPDDLLAAYLDEARRAVRYSRSRRYRARRAVGHCAGALADAEVWLVAVAFFAVFVLSVGFVGLVAYVGRTWPWLGRYVLLPVLTLLAVSFAVAAWWVGREERQR